MVKFCDVLNANGIKSSQIDFMKSYRIFHSNTFKYDKRPKFKRCNRQYTYEYHIFNMLFTTLNIMHSSSLINILVYVDKLIIQHKYLLEKEKDDSKEIIKTSDEPLNLNEYLKFRFKRMKIEINEFNLNHMNRYVIKKLKKKAKKVVEMLNTIVMLMQDSELKYLYDYLPYNDVMKSKLIIICPVKDMNLKEYSSLLELEKPTYVVNIDPEGCPLDLIFGNEMFRNNRNSKLYDIVKHENELFSGYMTRCLLNDLQNFLKIKPQVR